MIGKKIAFERKKRGITQTFVARKIGKTSAWLSNIERGIRNIKIDKLIEVANIIGVDPAFFLTHR